MFANCLKSVMECLKNIDGLYLSILLDFFYLNIYLILIIFRYTKYYIMMEIKIKNIWGVYGWV